MYSPLSFVCFVWTTCPVDRSRSCTVTFGSTSPVWLDAVPAIDPFGWDAFGAAANTGEPARVVANVRTRARIRFIVLSVCFFSADPVKFFDLSSPVQIDPERPHLFIQFGPLDTERLGRLADPAV